MTVNYSDGMSVTASEASTTRAVLTLTGCARGSNQYIVYDEQTTEKKTRADKACPT